MLKNLFIAAASAFAISGGSVMAADEYTDGLKMGGLITTCQYYLAGVFEDPKFGAYMIEAQYDELTRPEQKSIIKIWNERNSTKCVHASHGHYH